MGNEPIRIGKKALVPVGTCNIQAFGRVNLFEAKDNEDLKCFSLPCKGAPVNP
jgi:hypothetical protein